MASRTAIPAWCLQAQADTRSRCAAQDGTVYINRDLKAGDTYQVPNLPGFTLATSNAGAVEVDLDGQAHGSGGAEPANSRAGFRSTRSPLPTASTAH